MKIAIISDTHDNSKNVEKFIAFCKKNEIQAIIHCGDVCRRDTLDLILKNLDIKIFLSLGNGDMPNDFLDLKDNPKIEIFEHIGVWDLPEINIAFAHYRDMVRSFSKKCHFIFYGHTHKPWIEIIGEQNAPISQQHFIACPGNLAGINYSATFAVLNTDTKKIELKILDRI